MDESTGDSIWGPDNPIIATWPASMIPTAIALMFVLVWLAKPELMRRVFSRQSTVLIICVYVGVFVIGNIIFVLTRMTFEDRILLAMGSCDVRCLPIQESWQDHVRRIAWAMLVVPSIMLSPVVLFFYIERGRLRHVRARAAGS